MDKESLEKLLNESILTNAGEVKENDVLVFQFDYKTVDAHILGEFMKLINEQGYKCVAYPQLSSVVEKHEVKTALKILDFAKKSLEDNK